MTVSIAIERYLSVCHPTHVFVGKSLLIPLPVAFAILYNIPKFFEFASCSEEEILQSLTSEFFQGEQKLGNLSFSKLAKGRANSMDYYFYPPRATNHNLTLPENSSLSEIHSMTASSILSLGNDGSAKIHCDSAGIRMTQLRMDPHYIIFYIFWSKILLVEVIPWIAVIVLSVLAWRGIQKFQIHRDNVRRQGNTNQGISS